MLFFRNMDDIKYLIKVSRPRFWLYLAGPFLIGMGANIDLLSLYALFYFTIPANIFLYGVNDLWDQETDKLNSKKIERESRISSKSQEVGLQKAVFISFILALPIFIYGNFQIKLLLASFLFLAYFYSASPLRLKGVYFLDSISNVLYIIPGLISYAYFSGGLPKIPVIMAGAMWGWAMHLFSAIPDIIPDTKAQIKTTAVLLGSQKSLLLCSFYWFFGAYFLKFHLVLLFICAFYALIPLALFIKKSNSVVISKFYWYFPLLNGIFGFGIYLLRLISN